MTFAIYLFVAAALSLAILALGLRLLFKPARDERAGSAQLCLGLCGLSPVLMVSILMLYKHLARTVPFSVALASPQEKMRVLTKIDQGWLSSLENIHWLPYLTMILLCALAMGAAMLAAWRLQQRGKANGLALTACLGLNTLAGLVGGAGWWVRIHGQALWEGIQTPGSELTELGAQAITPIWFYPLAIGVACLAGGVAVVQIWQAQSPRLEGTALAASLLVLGLGVTAYAVTRSHAKDVQEHLPALLGQPGEDGRIRPIDFVESAVLTRFEVGDFGSGQFKLDPNLALPSSTSGLDFTWALDVTLTLASLKVEGRTIAELEAGRLPAKLIGPHGTRIESLYRLLKKFREIEESGKLPNGNETVIAVQADKHLPARTLTQVLYTAAMAGYPNYRLVVAQPKPGLPTRTRVAVISASVPVAAEPEPDEKPDEKIGRVRFGKAAGPEDDPKRITLSVQIRKDGFQISASGTTQSMEDLKALNHHIPIRPDRSFDFPALTQYAKKIHDAYPGSDTAIFLPSDHIAYQTLISCMDAVRERVIDKRLRSTESLFTIAVISRILD